MHSVTGSTQGANAPLTQASHVLKKNTELVLSGTGPALIKTGEGGQSMVVVK